MKMPTRGYLICCVERTGSTLLGQALYGSGVAGRPQEYFNPVEQEKPLMRGILGESTMVDGLPKILEAGTTPNGVFGAKIHGGHFRNLGLRISGERRDQPGKPQQAQLPDLGSEAAVYELLRSRHASLRPHAAALQALRELLPDLRIVWQRRTNMVARAVSHFRARETGVWHRGVTAGGGAAAQKPHEYDLAKIRYLYCLGVFEDALWERFFDEQKIEPHCVIYEDLIANYEPAVRGVLNYLDVGKDLTVVPPPRSVKQSDAVSEEWEMRYREVSDKALPFAPVPLSRA